MSSEETRSFKSELVTSDCYLPDDFIMMKALKLLNNHLSNAQYEITWAIKIDDPEKFIALGGEHLKLDFDLEVTRGVFYKPFIVAAVMERLDCLKIMI